MLIKSIFFWWFQGFILFIIQGNHKIDVIKKLGPIFQGSIQQKLSFFGITVLLNQNKNSAKPLVFWKQFCEIGSENTLGNWTPVSRADVTVLDEVVQKLQVRRLKVLILTIRPRRLMVIVNRNHFTTPKFTQLEKNIQQTSFQFHNF